MGMRQSQALKQSQSLAMNLQIQQKLKILMLSRYELEDFIGNELKENPCLEIADEFGQPTELGAQDRQELDFGVTGKSEAENFSAPLDQSVDGTSIEGDLRSLGEVLRESSKDDSYSLTDFDSDQGNPLYERVRCDTSLLHEELEDQIRFMHLTDYEMECCLLILQYISDSGFLSQSLESIEEETDIPIDDLKFSLGCIQKCDPVGVGARDTRECLLLQLKSHPKPLPLAKRILEDSWSLFEKQDLQKIAKVTKSDLEQVKKAMIFIRENFDPRPARQFGESSNNVVTPDVFVFKREGEWVVSINEDGLPRLKLSEKYSELLKTALQERQSSKEITTGGGVKKYLSERFKEAKWIVSALSERNRTIVKVVECILTRQIEFFDKGPEFLKPLILKDIANELGVHESTISRATNLKYLHSPRGIFELKFFFNTSISSEDGQDLPNETVKNWVAEYIKTEDPNKPFSDQDISDLIEKEKNMKIARRTVSKYREHLGIQSSSKRVKKF